MIRCFQGRVFLVKTTLMFLGCDISLLQGEEHTCTSQHKTSLFLGYHVSLFLEQSFFRSKMCLTLWGKWLCMLWLFPITFIPSHPHKHNIFLFTAMRKKISDMFCHDWIFWFMTLLNYYQLCTYMYIFLSQQEILRSTLTY